MINIKNLSKSYGENKLFNHTSLIIHDNQKIALIGQNGSGKSTLFRCISGEEDFEGSITISSGMIISLMEQEKTFSSVKLTFLDYLKSKKQKVIQKLKEIEEKLGMSEYIENTDLYSKLLQEYELLCSRQTEDIEIEKLKQLLLSLKQSDEILHMPIFQLSGGQITSLRLIESLSKKADVYLLDEPTNHLDFEAIKWLEKEINESDSIFLVISHDRYFINEIANKVVEIEEKKLLNYEGGYSNYLKKRRLHRIAMEKNHDSTERERKRLLASSKDKRKWAHKDGSKALKIQADKLERRANELQKVANPNELEDRYDFEIKQGERTSDIIFEVENLSKSFGDKKLLEGISFVVRKNQRVAIIGENGSGKSTLMKILLGKEKYLGKIRHGNNLNIGYFDQESSNLPLNDKVLEYLLDKNTHYSDPQITKLALNFGFGNSLGNKIKKLSGGEKARLQLLNVLTRGHNVLLLDEPTNHLDIELKESLEKALRHFKGAVVFVSHDRYFIDKVATHSLIISDKKAELVEGGFSDNFK